MPPIINSHTRYFATLPLDENANLEVSLFTSIAESTADDLFITNHINQIKTSASPLVQFVCHPFSTRSKQDGLNAAYNSCALIIGAETTEVSEDLSSGNKLGGTPIIFRQDVLVGISQLLAEGYVHFAHFSYPGPDDAGGGEWELGNFPLSVFANETNGNFDFRYVFS